MEWDASHTPPPGGTAERKMLGRACVADEAEAGCEVVSTHARPADVPRWLGGVTAVVIVA